MKNYIKTKTSANFQAFLLTILAMLGVAIFLIFFEMYMRMEPEWQHRRCKYRRSHATETYTVPPQCQVPYPLHVLNSGDNS